MRQPFIAIMGALIVSGCTYGPEQDYSRFNGAALLSDGRVAVSHHRLTGRPATGFAAFPDGGVPRYTRDWHSIFIVDGDGTTRRIARFEGGGLPASGAISLMPMGADADTLLLHRYAQKSTSLPMRYLDEFVRMRPDGSIIERFDLAGTLRERGRTVGAKGFGTLRVLDDRGTMLVGAEHGAVRELWLRTPDGQLQRVDRFDDFRDLSGRRILYMRDGDVVIRDLADGSERVTSWKDRAAIDFRAAPEPARRATVSIDGKTISVSGPDEVTREIQPDLAVVNRD